MQVSKLDLNTQAIISGNGENLMLINESTLDSVVIGTAKSHFVLNNPIQPKWSSTLDVQALKGCCEGVSIGFKVYDETNPVDNYLAHDYVIDVFHRQGDEEANIVRVHIYDIDNDDGVDSEVMLVGIENLSRVTDLILAHIRTDMSSEDIG